MTRDEMAEELIYLALTTLEYETKGPINFELSAKERAKRLWQKLKSIEDDES